MIALRCWNATVVVGSSWRLASSSFGVRARRTSSVPANRLAAVERAAPDGDELLEDGRVGAFAELDERAGDERPIRLAAAQRMMIGRRAVTPAGTRSTTPWLQQARVSCANRSSAGSEPPSSARAPRGRRRRESASGSSVTPAAAGLGSRASVQTRSSWNDARPAVPASGSDGPCGASSSPRRRRTGRRRRGPRSAGRSRSCRAGSSRPAAPRTGAKAARRSATSQAGSPAVSCSRRVRVEPAA